MCRLILVGVAIPLMDDFLNEIGAARHDLLCAFLGGARLLPHIPPLRIQLV